MPEFDQQPPTDKITRLSERSRDPITNAVIIGITDFITKTTITHPCRILRRQCQVHQNAKTLHLTPFTLIPVVCRSVSNEGISTLYKGVIGSGVLSGLSTAAEVLIADLFGLPRSYVKHGSVEKFYRHLILKACTAFVTTPFIVSSFIETVKSENGFDTEELRLMDVITNGINRLRFDFIGPKDNSKRFSLLYLSVPTAILHTTNYLIASSIYDFIHDLAKRYVDRKPTYERAVFHQYLPQIFATLTSQMVADFVCYPFETVLHRLYIQGTRTLIDNLDNGVTAISITAKYTGLIDCMKSIVNREGFWSLYAGVGALGLQYFCHMCLLRFIRSMLEYGSRGVNGSQNAIPTPSNSSTYRITSPIFDFNTIQNETSAGAQSADFLSPTNANFSTYPSFGQTMSKIGQTSASSRSPKKLTDPSSSLYTELNFDHD